MAGEYKDHAILMKQKLDSVSKSFCLAKWQQVSLHLPQGLTQSCYHPPTHKISIDEILRNPGALHNTSQKILERKQMKEGERPEGCSYCWKIEDAKCNDSEENLSDRHYRSSEWWSSPTFDEVVSNSFDYDVIPRYVEVNFNQACNFKCMYCSPHLSTAWEEELKKHGGFILENLIHNDLRSLETKGLMPLQIANRDNPYVQAFWNWWPNIYRKLRVFRMTGGEPLMDKNTFKVLDYVNENPHGQLELSVTSNMCPPDQKLFDLFVEKIKKIEIHRTYEDKENYNEHSNNYWYVDKGFKHFWLYVSLDSVGRQAEYIRSGLEYDRLIGNTKIFLKETRYTTVSFINTFNLLSIPKLKGFLQLILDLRKEFGAKYQEEFLIAPESTEHETQHGIVHKQYKQKKFQRIYFDIPLLRYPDWFNVRYATSDLIDTVRDCIKFMEENKQLENYGETFEGFKPHEISKLKRNLAMMEEYIDREEININRKRFLQFIQQYDYRRKTNFLEIFPEMQNYIETCETVDG
jgi:organic radical activating enzyme